VHHPYHSFFYDGAPIPPPTTTSRPNDNDNEDCGKKSSRRISVIDEDNNDSSGRVGDCTRRCVSRAINCIIAINGRNTPLQAASYVKPPLNIVMGLFRLGRGRTLRDMGVNCDDECDDDWWMMGGGECDDWDAPIWATTSVDNWTPFLGEWNEGMHGFKVPIAFAVLIDNHWDFACRALAFATPHVHPHSPRLAPVRLGARWPPRLCPHLMGRRVGHQDYAFVLWGARWF
jgi:hypothetical protein